VSPARDSSLQNLLRTLNAAADPQGVWDRVTTLRVPVDISGALVGANQPSMFSSPGVYAEIWLDEEQVIFHEVPSLGQRAVFSGNTVTLVNADGVATVCPDMPGDLRRRGHDPQFLLQTAATQSGPVGFPLKAARKAVLAATGMADRAAGGRFSAALRSRGIEPGWRDRLTKANLVYFFGYSVRFYARMVKLLEDPRTQVTPICPDGAIRRGIRAKLGIEDPRGFIGLSVTWPEEVRTHSRDMDLFFDPKTHLLAFFRYDVDTINGMFRAWHRVTDWCQDPDSGLMGVRRRRALVSPGGLEFPNQPWTVDAKLGLMTATLQPNASQHP
jgi:hypothetical protein